MAAKLAPYSSVTSSSTIVRYSSKPLSIPENSVSPFVIMEILAPMLLSMSSTRVTQSAGEQYQEERRYSTWTEEKVSIFGFAKKQIYKVCKRMENTKQPAQQKRPECSNAEADAPVLTKKQKVA